MARKSYTRGNAASPSRRSPLLLIAGAGAVVLILAGLVLLLSRPSSTATNGSPAETAPNHTGSSTRGPRLAVDQRKIDFGQVKVNQMVKARFVLTNAGDQPLQISGEPAVRVVEGC